MFVASFSFDMQYGTREEALKLIKEFGNARTQQTGWKAKHTRVLAGSIGAPESRVLIEHEFASLGDLESTWDSLQQNADQFRKFVQQMKTVVVSGTPRWEIYRVIDER